MKKLQDIPSPKALPLLGHMLELHRDMLGFYASLMKLGDVTRMRYFFIDAVQLTDPALIEQVLVRDSGKFKKSWDYKQLEIIVGEGLLTSEGELWKQQRKLIQPSFHRERIASYGAIMVRRALRRAAGWAHGETRDLHHEMSRITLQIVCEALFGLGIEGQAALVGNALDQFMARFETMLTSLVPLPVSVPTPGNLRARRALQRVDAMIYDMIAARRARKDQPDDLLGRLVLATDDEQGRMSDRQLRDELVTLLLAGHETTALALTYALMLLGQHREVEAKLHAELDAFDHDPGVADLDALPYTRQVVDEAMRLYPPAWGIGREVKEPVTLGDYALPAGTQVLLLPWLTHRDPRWFDQPLTFKPERWDNPTWPKYAYFPFGGGPRKCIGMHFALIEAVLVLSAVARRFTFELTGEPLQLMPAVTLRPRNPLRAVVRARDTSAARAKTAVA